MTDIIPNDEQFEQGARIFENCWLRPKKYRGQKVYLRVRINKGWNGWMLKDELVKSVGLTPGDTINTEVAVLGGPGLIDLNQAGAVDLFASGDGADWLLDHDVKIGSVVELEAELKYEQAPVGGLEGRNVWKLSLVFVTGFCVKQVDLEELSSGQSGVTPQALANLLKMLG